VSYYIDTVQFCKTRKIEFNKTVKCVLTNQINSPVMSNNIMPPAPPTLHQQKESKSTSCNFEYLSSDYRKYVKDAYDVISINEWWAPFREAIITRGVDSNLGFIFTDDPLYKQINNAVVSTRIGGEHSGCSLGCVMRTMEFIAVNGEPAYRRLVAPESVNSHMP